MSQTSSYDPTDTSASVGTSTADMPGPLYKSVSCDSLLVSKTFSSDSFSLQKKNSTSSDSWLVAAQLGTKLWVRGKRAWWKGRGQVREGRKIDVKPYKLS